MTSSKQKEYRIAIPATLYFSVVASRKRDALSKARKFHKEFVDGDGLSLDSMLGFGGEAEAEAVRVYANDKFEPSIEDVHTLEKR